MGSGTEKGRNSANQGGAIKPATTEDDYSLILQGILGKGTNHMLQNYSTEKWVTDQALLQKQFFLWYLLPAPSC